jgi:serpin B
MVVLLPNPGSFQEFELGLDRTTLEAVIAAMRATTLVFSIPRFRFGNSFGLSQALSRLGMRKPFAAELANFSGMTGARGLFATELVHQAFIGIEEAGTEAAGASAVALAPSQPGVELPVTIDRPFIFLIRDRESGQILFAGRVLNPAR